MNAAEAIELFDELAKHTAISIYRDALNRTVIPALRQLPPEQTVDYGLLKSIPCAAFKSVRSISDAFGVVYGATEGLTTHGRENPLADKIRMELKYTVVSRNIGKPPSTESGRGT